MAQRVRSSTVSVKPARVGTYLLGDQRWRWFSRNECGGDDDVDLPALLHKELHLCFDEFIGHDLGIAAAPGSVFLDVDFDEVGTERLDLLACCRSGVETANDGAETTGL